MVRFFIGRPIFAVVVALVTILLGAIAIPVLPVAQFPQIAPPSVSVSATYRGAGAEVVERAVTVPIEQQINGVEGMRYISSTSSSDGSMSINVTFEQGYDQDVAAIDVQNRVSLAQPRLPEEVLRQGITIRKQSSDLTLIVALTSSDRDHDETFLSNYAAINVIDALNRVDGVSEARIFSSREYAMRAWLDPDALAVHGLDPRDVVRAIREQNLQASLGRVGTPPTEGATVGMVPFDYTLVAEGRLTEGEQFADIVLASGPDGALVRLRDVARVELGAESYTGFKRVDGEPVATIGIFQLPEANALDVAEGVNAELERISQRFPPGLEVDVPVDPTQFVRESIREVLVTLTIALTLVVLVTYLFLGTARATIVPAVTIPVALVGAFAVMWALGFSINTLTLFGLVLAIGVVVDDAIVVVENIERLVRERGLRGRQAARAAMREVTAPVIATSVVLAVVFVPAAFVPGVTGQLYRQFSLTIVAAVGLSMFNALTLSPALSAMLLRKQVRMLRPLQWFSDWLDRRRAGYERALRRAIGRWKLVMVVFAGLVGATWIALVTLPRTFIPDEDQGYFIVSARLPDAASTERTDAVAREVEAVLGSIDGVAHHVAIGGFDLRGGRSASNIFTVFAALEPWEARAEHGRDLETVLGEARARLGRIQEAEVFAFNPPPIRGLSSTGGFDFKLLDRSGGDYGELYERTRELLAALAQRPAIARPSTTSAGLVPQIRVEVDRTRAAAADVPLPAIFEALQLTFGAYYVNDFNLFGRIYRVMVQGQAAERDDPEDVGDVYVKNRDGQLVRLDELVRAQRDHGADSIERFNLFRATSINGQAAPGHSSSEALDVVEQTLRDTLPAQYDGAWAGLAYEERASAGYTIYIFGLGVLLTFLVLAALYESWSLPLVIMLAVPPAILGALGLMFLRGIDNDVYCQIGLLLLVGMACKNAILIVEFARELVYRGATVVEAAIEASGIRLRPILMTAISFIVGVAPLAFASGAGAVARRSLGTAVLGGMLLTTILSLFLVPVLFVLVGRIAGFERKRRGGEDDEEPAPSVAPEPAPR